MQQCILQICNCTDPQSLSLLKNNITCELIVQQECMDNQYELILDENFITSTCVPQCPLECNRTAYKAFISSCEIIGDFYYDYIKSNANLLSDFVERNLTIEQTCSESHFF
jgi:hypothetical protein